MKKIIQDSRLLKYVIFAVILLIPMIYSFFYLKAYWDPYGHLEDIKVGIVNLDKGIEGKNEGNKLKEELKDSGEFDFVDVSSIEEANKGLGNDLYYAIITIPEDFSEKLNSASEKNKQIAKIIYTPNKRKNYLASQILNSALKTVELKLQGQVSKEVTATLADSLKDIPEDLQEISNGADKIIDGSVELNEGLNTLNEGINTLDSKYTDFDKGIKRVYSGSSNLTYGIQKIGDGVKNLSNGSRTLDDSIKNINEGVDNLEKSGTEGIDRLSEGINTLQKSSEDLSKGTSDYVDGANTLADGTKEYINGSTDLADGINAYFDGTKNLDEQTKKYLETIVKVDSDGSMGLKSGAEAILAGRAQAEQKKEKLKIGADLLKENNSKLLQGADNLKLKGKQLKNGASLLNEGASKLKNGSKDLSQITNGITKLKSALSQVKEGTSSLNSGVNILQNGNDQVLDGSKNLQDGIKVLKLNSSSVKEALDSLGSGSKTILEGSGKLKDGAEEFKVEISKGIDTAKSEVSKLEGLEEYTKDPVQIEENSYGEVDSYGIAFAPLFISIGLWVGALMFYVVLYYDQRHRFGILDHDSPNSKIIQNIIYLGLGIIVGIVTGFILKWGLGYEVVNLGTYILTCALVGLTFMSIIQFLIRNFGDVGKFIALIVLVLQLAASGGTFPVETISDGFKGFTAFLPMTYTIRAFKDILINTDNSLLATNIYILIGIVIIVNLINLVIELIKKNKIEETHD